jgi:6-phosphogluconolactonase
MSEALTFYLVGLSAHDDGGIFTYSIVDNDVSRLGFTCVRNVSYIIFSPNRQVIDAACKGPAIGSVAAFKGTSGGLEPLNSIASRGNSPCHAVVNRATTLLYTPNYRENGDASLTEISLSPDGSLGAPTKGIRHSQGTGPVLDRQDGPHVHCSYFTPDEGDRVSESRVSI